jgi:hypothetical protein
MGGACNTHGKYENPEGKRPLGTASRRWEHNINMGWKVVDWIYLSKDRNQWQALVNTVP